MIQNLQYMQIEPTTRCNYTCGFCAGRHMKQQDLDFNTFKTLLDAAHELKHIELQGEGEPLLHPHFFDMIDYARTRFPSIAISFITNGSLFNSENIAKIVAANIHTVLISIESTDETEFQAIRGGKLARVKRGIKELIERKSALNIPLKVGFAVTVLKRTVSQINSIGELYRELKMDGGINVQPLQSMDCYVQFYDEAMKDSILDKEDMVELRARVEKDENLRIALSVYRSQKSFYASLFSSIPSGVSACPWLENGLYVAANGVAASCAFVKDIEENGYAPIKKGLANILAQRARLANALRQKELPSQCRGCAIAYNILRFSSNW